MTKFDLNEIKKYVVFFAVYKKNELGYYEPAFIGTGFWTKNAISLISSDFV